MHFRKKSLTQVSLDEPYSNSDGAKIRREYGAKDNCLTGCVDRVALNNAIKDLPQGYRTIFVLHEVEGYEHQEIAEMLGCSVGIRNRNCTKPSCEFVSCCRRHPSGELRPSRKSGFQNQPGRYSTNGIWLSHRLSLCRYPARSWLDQSRRAA